MWSSENIQATRVEWFLGVIRGMPRGLRVLDIGCQTGDVCAHLVALGHQACGVEIDAESVKRARLLHPGIAFEQADCESHIPFEDASFDVVWAGEVIEHIRFTDVFVNEVNRVLTNGGLFVLTTPMHGRLKNILIACCNFERHFDPEFPHYRFYTQRSLRSVLEKRGMEVTAVSYLGRVWPIAQNIAMVARKTASKKVYSEHRH